MRKIIGMIPARAGSKRVRWKNIRLLDGKPLIAYIIEAAKSSSVFDEIYVNSEADIIGDIAKNCGVKFYKRPAYLTSDKVVNDEFVIDFMRNIPGDILVQMLPTSPLISHEEIRGFVQEMLRKRYDTLISVKNQQIACVYRGKPINFDISDHHISSQQMEPVQSYATVLMAWVYRRFIKNIKKYGGAYHGCNGKVGYYLIKGLSTIDIDDEEDFALAEVALQFKKKRFTAQRKYYRAITRKGHLIEHNVKDILIKDGVMDGDCDHENIPLVNISQVIKTKSKRHSWFRRLINTENNSATLISQLPGEGNRWHYHPDWNEWWYIVEGQWLWEIDGKKITVKKGDIVFNGKNKLHRITAAGKKPAVRLAVSKDMIPHVYPKDNK